MLQEYLIITRVCVHPRTFVWVVLSDRSIILAVFSSN